MNKKIVFMFSGQGSQYYQMGKDLYENEPVFRMWMHELDEIPKEILGESIVDIIYNQEKTKSDKFDKTIFTHPAIFMIEYSLAMVLLKSGIRPDYLLGTSLGEFTCAAISEIIKVDQALKLLMFQADCIDKECKNGGMIAVLANHHLYKRESLLFKNSSLAGVNFDNHFVISGYEYELQEIGDYLKKREISHMFLPVTHGFHSPSIDPAYKKYAKQMIVSSTFIPRIGYLSSNNGSQLHKINATYFWDIVREPILFRETVQSLLGINSYCKFIDLSPSGTLATFLKYGVNDKNVEIEYIMTPFGNEKKKISVLKKVFENKQ